MYELFEYFTNRKGIHKLCQCDLTKTWLIAFIIVSLIFLGHLVWKRPMKLDSIHQLLVKWSTSEYGWLSSAITLERSSIRAAKALSLIEINDTRHGLVDDSGTFFLRPDRWLRRWNLRVIVYSTLIKYTRCLRSSLPIINIDSIQIIMETELQLKPWN